MKAHALATITRLSSLAYSLTRTHNQSLPPIFCINYSVFSCRYDEVASLFSDDEKTKHQQRPQPRTLQRERE